MFIMTRTILVEKGNSDKVVARFSGEGPMDNMDGLVDISVMVNTKSKEQEEVVVVIRWESQEAWKNWEKSDAHIQGHKENRGKQPPAYVLSTEVKLYEGEVVKRGKAYR
ncbi:MULTISPECIES: antibiotic biosynthesis monooxygenase [Paenibacillus]|uniref:Heme-degrading monooxygenase HmoA n=1 Tax=Paenibacillus vini TaxID=1476024 RepID=A0ABQ4MA16_9BACL|nr:MULTISPECIES: antibiotic biosynthesis monooxygenase [Paenibacillus]MBQ4902011.1 antibiotic biosynthesis monooxygenase [Paenibacillus sp. Marseille-P2973]GIP52826.1 heme-degrading monooxygenase HmoA [Paenibacillus vini]